MKRPKTKLRCSKCGYRWKEVVFTSSVLDHPPYCPKCARKGIKAVGEPVKVVPLRKRLKSLAKAVLVKPVYYGALMPLKYAVLKPSLLGLRAGWWTLKMKLWAASLPFRAAFWLVALPFRTVNRLLAPPPKVIVLGEGSEQGGFLGESSRPGEGYRGFVEDEDEDEDYEEDCESSGCDGCPDYAECHGLDEGDTGFLPEETITWRPFHQKVESGRTGFAPEGSGRSGFAPEDRSQGGFLR